VADITEALRPEERGHLDVPTPNRAAVSTRALAYAGGGEPPGSHLRSPGRPRRRPSTDGRTAASIAITIHVNEATHRYPQSNAAALQIQWLLQLISAARQSIAVSRPGNQPSTDCPTEILAEVGELVP
jgi:hypothetical protein